TSLTGINTSKKLVSPTNSSQSSPAPALSQSRISLSCQASEPSDRGSFASASASTSPDSASDSSSSSTSLSSSYSSLSSSSRLIYRRRHHYVPSGPVAVLCPSKQSLSLPGLRLDSAIEPIISAIESKSSNRPSRVDSSDAIDVGKSDNLAFGKQEAVPTTVTKNQDKRKDDDDDDDDDDYEECRKTGFEAAVGHRKRTPGTRSHRPGRRFFELKDQSASLSSIKSVKDKNILLDPSRPASRTDKLSDRHSHHFNRNHHHHQLLDPPTIDRLHKSSTSNQTAQVTTNLHAPRTYHLQSLPTVNPNSGDEAVASQNNRSVTNEIPRNFTAQEDRCSSSGRQRVSTITVSVSAGNEKAKEKKKKRKRKLEEENLDLASASQLLRPKPASVVLTGLGVEPHSTSVGGLSRAQLFTGLGSRRKEADGASEVEEDIEEEDLSDDEEAEAKYIKRGSRQRSRKHRQREKSKKRSKQSNTATMNEVRYIQQQVI
ncbi:unnamed protein product, partial [Protopolystoma xenopodis]